MPTHVQHCWQIELVLEVVVTVVVAADVVVDSSVKHEQGAYCVQVQGGTQARQQASCSSLIIRLITTRQVPSGLGGLSVQLQHPQGGIGQLPQSGIELVLLVELVVVDCWVVVDC
jgi:hypothetical protein